MASVKKEGFPRSIRIKKDTEFQQVVKCGAKKQGKNLILFRLVCADGEGQKFGIRIAKGIKKAVDRNKIKRMIREVLRKNKDKFDQDEKVVVLCKSTAEGKDLHGLKEELEKLINVS